jgi:hypothetical protein
MRRNKLTRFSTILRLASECTASGIEPTSPSTGQVHSMDSGDVCRGGSQQARLVVAAMGERLDKEWARIGP